MPSQMLSSDIERGVQQFLRQQMQDLPEGAVDSLGEKDISEGDQLVFQTPCVRTRYLGVDYVPMRDNTALAYQAPHLVEIWCADEDMRSKEAEREATKRLLDRVTPIICGARIPLSDDPGVTSDPILLRRVYSLIQDIVGSVYILVIEVNGVAQFPGLNE